MQLAIKDECQRCIQGVAVASFDKEIASDYIDCQLRDSATVALLTYSTEYVWKYSWFCHLKVERGIVCVF